ncbi:MAG: ABC transporter ATP-binding protein [Candidatus Wallbacteria bacterium]|nr:ABC transporter ATP-binding protein [Candidatus Wallbacteria bacterium]
MLEIRELDVFYGAVHALKGVSIEVRPGEIVTLVGANGAGKSTTLRALSGLVTPRAGEILFDGASVLGCDPVDIVARGLIHCPEGRRVFAPMSVRENLEMGAFLRRDKPAIAQDLERVYTLFPRLRDRMGQAAGTLSGGEQQMLAIGRSMMARPRVLLLDEPSLGLAPLLVDEIFRIIRKINQEGVTVMLVEQNAHMALRCAHRGYVLETGKVLLHGPASEVEKNPQVREAYLGA